MGGKRAGQASHYNYGQDTLKELGGNCRQVFARGAKGQDLLEFAVVLPFLLLVAFGVLDLGRLFHAGITITNSARVGARYAARNRDASNGLIELATIDEAKNTGIELTTGQITIYCPYPTVKTGTCDPGIPIRIAITYDFDLILSGFLNLPSITLDRYIEMVVQ